MKKYLYMIMAAATLMVVGCEKNIETTPENGVEQECSLTISLPTDTKVTFDGTDGYKSTWDNGDEILVEMSNGGYRTYSYSGQSGKKLATFKGRGTPKNGGKVLYPASSWEEINNKYYYNFNDSYVWDQEASSSNKINSVVPMVGTIDGTKAIFNYASGAILLEYSKITLSAVKIVVDFGGPNVTGYSSISEKLSAPQTITSGGRWFPTTYEAGTSVTIWMNSDKTAIGGTPTNCKFLIPVPEGTYSTLRIRMFKDRNSNYLIGGSDYSSKRSFKIDNEDLRIFPKIVPDFPNYTMVIWDPSQTPTPGTYILAHDNGDGTAWVNGDDNLRETLPAHIILLNNDLGYDEQSEYYNKPGIVLDQADYETAAWKVNVSSSDIGATWTIQTGRKGTLYAYYLGFNDGFIQLNIGRYNSEDNNIRYYTGEELDNGDFNTLDPRPSNSIWDNGGFIYGPDKKVESNIKLFRLVENPPTPPQQ